MSYIGNHESRYWNALPEEENLLREEEFLPETASSEHEIQLGSGIPSIPLASYTIAGYIDRGKRPLKGDTLSAQL